MKWWFKRQIDNLGIDRIGSKKYGWWLIPNYIWNSGLSRGEFYYFLAKVFNPKRYNK